MEYTTMSNYKCDNCGRTYECKADMDEIEDLSQRIEPGGIYPAGQCRECVALCYPTESLEPVKVCAAIVFDKYGNDCWFISRTADGLRDKLYDHVKARWDSELPGKSMPEDRQDAIDEYFDADLDERAALFGCRWYALSGNLDGPAQSEPPPVEKPMRKFNVCVRRTTFEYATIPIEAKDEDSAGKIALMIGTDPKRAVAYVGYGDKDFEYQVDYVNRA